MADTQPQERYSRQVILPGVGQEGQAKWAASRILLAGEGVILTAAETALKSSGISNLLQWKTDSPQAPIGDADLTLVLTENSDFRRRASRWLRKNRRPALFAWCAGSGYALFAASHWENHCPCLECFETLNPKAFAGGTPTTQRLLGALAASEALQWILKGSTPLASKVWVTSLDSGVSFHHEVKASDKCPVRLSEEGAVVTP